MARIDARARKRRLLTQKSARTNARGVARITVTPRRPGIVTITVPQKITCGGRRIGVVGAFVPQFTG